jgi:hypothetical protein
MEEQTDEQTFEQTFKEEIEEIQKRAADNDQLAVFLAATKERFDKHFDHLGYVCFVFDKSNPENAYIANISNVPVKGYLRKLLPFLAKYRQAFRKLNKNRSRNFRRVK